MSAFASIVSASVVLRETNIDTDQIIPARFLSTTERKGLGRYAFNDWRWREDGTPNPQFAFNQAANAGREILIAGRNFGCGSSREHAPIAIKAAGVQAVVAQSFARIFFRNAINIGLPVVEAPEAVAEIETGDVIEIDTDAGTVRNTRTGKTYQSTQYDEFIQQIIRAGGLMQAVAERVKARQQAG